MKMAFALGDNGELFSWGRGDHGTLGHGDMQDQLLPKRVEALRGVRLSSASGGHYWHALALAEDGLVYAWGENRRRTTLGNPHVDGELLPKPVEALRGVRVSSVAAAGTRSYALADTGELWAWGCETDYAYSSPLGHGEEEDCPSPKPIEALQGVKVDAVATGSTHTLALGDDGRVYAWGNERAANSGALGLGPSVSDAPIPVRTPQRIPALRVSCGL
jgi:E3 ubiquitin-protein ligase HERC2